MATKTFEEKISRIKNAVHSDLDYNKYESYLRDYTNCYSHAIGSTLNFIELYRVGAFCGKKPLDQEYFSTGEIESLLFEDLKVLDLQIEKSFLGEEMEENQYQILLLVKIYADKRIHDFHFLRHDKHGWSEKWRFHCVCSVENPINYYDHFPWHIVGLYKITK